MIKILNETQCTYIVRCMWQPDRQHTTVVLVLTLYLCILNYLFCRFTFCNIYIHLRKTVSHFDSGCNNRRHSIIPLLLSSYSLSLQFKANNVVVPGPFLCSFIHYNLVCHHMHCISIRVQLQIYKQ